MSGWDGNGNFVRIYSWVADKLAGINITASRMDADTNNITNNGFGNCLTRDGQGSATNNLPMNNFQHTGVGNATAVDQYAVTGQVQVSSYNTGIGAGSGDAVIANFLPALTSLTNKMILFVSSAGTNTVTAPTFSPNGLPAHTITKFGGKPLQPGDIAPANILILSYNLSNTRWELLNPTFGMNVGVPWAVASGAADAITATYSPANTSLADGLLLSFRASAANATTTPTFSPDGLTAHTITKNGGSALVAGDIAANLAEYLMRYNLANTRWELLNPVDPLTPVTLPSYHAQLFTASGTFTIPTGTVSATLFKFTGVGGGGGSGGVSTANGAASAGAGGGGGFIAMLSGFTAAGTVAVTIGGGGAAGAAGADGSDGTDTTLVYSAATIATGGHGAKSLAATVSTPGSSGGALGGTASVPGGGGLTVVASQVVNGQGGGVALSNTTAALGSSGFGGSTVFGPGAAGTGGVGTAGGNSGNRGTGASGAIRESGADQTGGAGVGGAVLIEWWL